MMGIRSATALNPPRRSAKVLPSWNRLPPKRTGAPGNVLDGTVILKVTFTSGEGFQEKFYRCVQVLKNRSTLLESLVGAIQRVCNQIVRAGWQTFQIKAPGGISDSLYAACRDHDIGQWAAALGIYFSFNAASLACKGAIDPTGDHIARLSRTVDMEQTITDGYIRAAVFLQLYIGSTYVAVFHY